MSDNLSEFEPPSPTEEDLKLQSLEKVLQSTLVVLFDTDSILLLIPFVLTLYRRIPYNHIKNYFVTKVRFRLLCLITERNSPIKIFEK